MYPVGLSVLYVVINVNCYGYLVISQVYKQYPLFMMEYDKFQVVIHHGGYFVNEGGIKYVNGQRSELWCDEDRWSYFEVLFILREMGYINVKDLCYSVGGCLV